MLYTPNHIKKQYKKRYIEKMRYQIYNVLFWDFIKQLDISKAFMGMLLMGEMCNTFQPWERKIYYVQKWQFFINFLIISHISPLGDHGVKLAPYIVSYNSFDWACKLPSCFSPRYPKILW